MIPRYVGADRHGTARTGVVPDGAQLREWVEARFEQGWRRLTVLSGADVVARIGLVDGRRTWWSE